MERVIAIAEAKYPKESHTLVWLFDQSSGHCAFTKDALNVKQMNVRPGGVQPKMRDTTWRGEVQKMVLPDGWPKGSWSLRSMVLTRKRGGGGSSTPCPPISPPLTIYDTCNANRLPCMVWVRWSMHGQCMLWLPMLSLIFLHSWFQPSLVTRPQKSGLVQTVCSCWWVSPTISH